MFVAWQHQAISWTNVDLHQRCSVALEVLMNLICNKSLDIIPLQYTNFTNARMHLFHIPQCSIQNRNVHISVLNGALWDMEQVQPGICELGQLLPHLPGTNELNFKLTAALFHADFLSVTLLRYDITINVKRGQVISAKVCYTESTHYTGVTKIKLLEWRSLNWYRICNTHYAYQFQWNSLKRSKIYCIIKYIYFSIL